MDADVGLYSHFFGNKHKIRFSVHLLLNNAIARFIQIYFNKEGKLVDMMGTSKYIYDLYHLFGASINSAHAVSPDPFFLFTVTFFTK